MTSFKQLTKDGVLKRADAYKVQFADIVVEPGFNTREEGERLEAHVQALFQFIMDGGQLPALEVVPTADGKVKVRDGHCRHRAYGLAIEAGAPIDWIEVKQFVGNDVDQVARIVTSNEGLKLTQLEVARVYKRLRGFGLGPEDIAKRVGKTRQHVDQLLILADAPHQVQEMVAKGEVAATEAIKITRTHGEAAADMLGKAATTAGKGKVTAKALKPWTPPAKVVVSLTEELDAFVDALPTDARKKLAAIETAAKSGQLHDGQQVSIPAAALLSLLGEHAQLVEARTKAEERAKAKVTAENNKKELWDAVKAN